MPLSAVSLPLPTARQAFNRPIPLGILSLLSSLGKVFCSFSVQYTQSPYPRPPKLTAVNFFYNKNSAMESNIGVVCACLPCLPGLWRHAVMKNKHWLVRGLLSRISGSFVRSSEAGSQQIPECTSQEHFKADFGGHTSDENVFWFWGLTPITSVTPEAWRWVIVRSGIKGCKNDKNRVIGRENRSQLGR